MRQIVGGSLDLIGPKIGRELPALPLPAPFHQVPGLGRLKGGPGSGESILEVVRRPAGRLHPGTRIGTRGAIRRRCR